MRRRVFCVLLALVVLSFSFCVPVSAAGAGAAVVEYSTGPFAEMVLEGIVSGITGYAVNSLFDALGQSAADSSEDVMTHSSGDFGEHTHTWTYKVEGYGSDGKYYLATCSICGEQRIVKDSDLLGVYDSYVSELPATGIDSSGLFLLTADFWGYSVGFYRRGWTLGTSDRVFRGDSTSSVPTNFDSTSPYYSIASGMFVSGNESPLGATLIFVPNPDNDVYSDDCVCFTLGVSVPVSGVLSICGPVYVRCSSVNGDGSRKTFEFDCSLNTSFHLDSGYFRKRFLYSASDQYIGARNANSFVRAAYSLNCGEVTLSFSPDSGAIDFAHDVTYNYDSRAGSFVGDYGIIGDDGVLNVTHDHHIVNEDNHSYYNAVTGDTYDMPTYNYDYSTRTYNLTYTDPDAPEGEQTKQATVTYGDENITITDSGNTYNIYYVIENPQPDDSGHTHDYTGSVTRQPTCTATGVKTYSCTICNDTYTETIPALGHDWQVKTQVQTEYDEQGQLVTQGYTIFRCSRCGEEYRSDDSVNPSPPGSGGASGDAGAWTDFINWLKGLFGSVADAFKSIVESIIDIFSRIPTLFSGYLDFLGKIFPYLPEETTMLLSFGFMAVVAIGIIKILRR